VKRFDPWLVAAPVLLALAGVGLIYSAGGAYYFTRQLVFLPVAVAVGAAVALLPRRVLWGLAEPAYALVLVALVAVLFVGRGPGSNRWFALGSVTVQPSELAKLVTVILLGKYLGYERPLDLSPRRLALPLLIALVPAALVAVEPDLSTSLVFVFAFAVMLYWQGMRPLQLLLLFTPALSFVAGFSIYTWVPFFILLGALMLWRSDLGRTALALGVSAVFGLLSPLVMSLLKDYQRARIYNFVAPWLDPHGMGWNAIQSQIAIGSGRLFGKGFLHGTQKNLGFLPNRHTDFIFSSLAEEFGLAGCLVVLGLLALLVARMLRAAARTRDRSASLVITGFAAVIVYQSVVNVAMLLGLLPITGIPLPLLSYGGSSLVLVFAMVGFCVRVAARPE
jgi:rod shape determining protein RodA